jgi:hypothetical protein
MLVRLRTAGALPPALVLVLLALVLAVRMAVPTGWMPVSDADGFRFAICSSTGPVQAAMNHDRAMKMDHGAMGHESQAPEHGKTSADQPCAFAGLALASTPALPSLSLPPQLAATTAPPLPTHAVGVGRGLAAPPPPATGPPVLA